MLLPQPTRCTRCRERQCCGRRSRAGTRTGGAGPAASPQGSKGKEAKKRKLVLWQLEAGGREGLMAKKRKLVVWQLESLMRRRPRHCCSLWPSSPAGVVAAAWCFVT